MGLSAATGELTRGRRVTAAGTQRMTLTPAVTQNVS